MELGQDLLRSTLGEGYAPTPLEADFDGADEAYTCARPRSRRSSATGGAWRPSSASSA